MRVTLIHNPSAGDGDPSDADEIVTVIRAAGHRLAYQSSHEKNWQAALKRSADVVAVAGGDGTVGDVARLVQGRGVPLAVLPLGTANNIARMLGVTGIPLRQLVAGWSSALHLAFDVGIASGPWGQELFLESLGTGFFAWTMYHFDDRDNQRGSASIDAEHELRGARRFMRERLPQFSAQTLQVRLDGNDLSGEFLLLEALNIRSIGPGLFFAPRADPGDGLLDVVLVPAEDRDKLNEHFRDEAEDKQGYAALAIHTGKHLQVQGEGIEFHVDDRPWPDKTVPSTRGPVSIEARVLPRCLTFLVPDG